MRVRERTATLSQAELDAVLAPREVTLQEQREPDGSFIALDGPVSDYRRTVTATPVGEGRFRVSQRVEFNRSPDIGMWDLYLGPLLAAHLGRLGPNTKAPFWFPPDRIDGREISALAHIATIGFVLGYLSFLLSQTITFAAEEFGADKSDQGIALAFARLDVLLALPLSFLADRRGRRWLAINGTAVACGLTALGALVPNLVGLTASQVLARGVMSACAVSTAVMLAEEMPASARAWATSLAAMASGAGSGIAVFLLPVADLSDRAWRILFVVPLALIPLVLRAGGRIHETRRFQVHAENRVSAGKTIAVMRSHRGRFLLIGGSALLLSLFATPALQFQNEYLRHDRGFSGAQITLFITLTGAPGAIGIIVGGRLAESGRRAVGAAATFFGVALTVAQYWSHGVLIYAFSAVASIVGGAAVPALGVYGPELFPTEARGAANGAIGVLARVGSVVGLVAVGVLADRSSLSRAISYFAIGPVLLTILILVAYPETAHRELEDLNPEDDPL